MVTQWVLTLTGLRRSPTQQLAYRQLAALHSGNSLWELSSNVERYLTQGSSLSPRVAQIQEECNSRPLVSIQNKSERPPQLQSSSWVRGASVATALKFSFSCPLQFLSRMLPNEPPACKPPSPGSFPMNPGSEQKPDSLELTVQCERWHQSDAHTNTQVTRA